MRSALLLLLAGSIVRAQGPPPEPLDSVLHWFRRQYPAVHGIGAMNKQPIAAGYSALAAMGWLGKNAPPSLGVFIVYGKTNQVYMVLDILPPGETYFLPRLETPTRNAIYVHNFGYYGRYLWSERWHYDLLARRKLGHARYGRMSFQPAPAASGDPRWRASYEADERQTDLKSSEAWVGVCDGRPALGMPPPPPLPPEPSLPEWLREALYYDIEPMTPMREKLAHLRRVTESRWLLIQPGVTNGILAIERGRAPRFAPLPVVDEARFRELRPGKDPYGNVLDPSVGGINNAIGPRQLAGGALWFVNDFYAGEGAVGVGAIGRFDPATLEYTMHYLPEIVPWSGSALLVEGETIWVGLLQRPEGMPTGHGLLEWRRDTGVARVHPVDQPIHSIHRLGDSLWLATGHGLWRLRAGRLTQFRLEPGPGGPLSWVERDLAVVGNR